jgi:hypothetical protein
VEQDGLDVEMQKPRECSAASAQKIAERLQRLLRRGAPSSRRGSVAANGNANRRPSKVRPMS